MLSILTMMFDYHWYNVSSPTSLYLYRDSKDSRDVWLSPFSSSRVFSVISMKPILLAPGGRLISSFTVSIGVAVGNTSEFQYLCWYRQYF